MQGSEPVEGARGPWRAGVGVTDSYITGRAGLGPDIESAGRQGIERAGHTSNVPRVWSESHTVGGPRNDSSSTFRNARERR